jgi:hypothetical protein
MGQVYQCCWSVCREMNLFHVRISHVLRFIYICDPFTYCKLYYKLCSYQRIIHILWDWNLSNIFYTQCGAEEQYYY